MCSDTERSLLSQMNEWGFIDTFRLHNKDAGHFSWWDYRIGAFRRNMGYRIDHIWATKSLADICIKAFIDREPRKWERPSDHAPVLAKFDI
jgi:exodeoxyribonuclease-3